ncbi:MAG TPA: NAD(+)/NADH kinase [Candidatus Mcinerneyibacteriales bacterium]|nr:NAD(+)/NADH kinase [Candidatus Mcinerneyibacteriales bacterium]HPE20873.1 NAD(+)/NADH kinase [Candidatus Mcinerneyibacteriales bacterium]HPJ69645.1 NAD(+)/NADH kinase [Candidatus Mcinerneyibacteriales bacterium]HPQ89119.1 NAD(+)/NADH kinase [Candidatus Mcinerneyibacteriales bacterium]
MKISLISNPKQKEKWVGKTEPLQEWFRTHCVIEDDPEKAQWIVTLGGDGSLLYAMGRYGTQKSYFGINLGHLGFLTSADVTGTSDVLEDVFIRKIYKTELVRYLLYRGDGHEGLAVNDVVLKGVRVEEMSRFDVFLNGAFIHTQSADGLIVSSPVGSTAYNLSVGGSIIHPEAGGYILNSIASHALGIRPLVMGERHTLKIVPHQPMSLIIDGRLSGTVEGPLEVSLARDAFSLIRTVDWDFYQVLRLKMHWGKRGEEKC